MKTAILGPVFYFLVVFITLYSCRMFDHDETRIFIPGTYTRHYQDEYTDSYDTILIEAVTNESYHVIKKSNYRKIKDDQIWTPGSEVKQWTGKYDKETHTLFLSPSGKTMFFDPEKQELKVGTEPYKKQRL